MSPARVGEAAVEKATPQVTPPRIAPLSFDANELVVPWSEPPWSELDDEETEEVERMRRACGIQSPVTVRHKSPEHAEPRRLAGHGKKRGGGHGRRPSQ